MYLPQTHLLPRGPRHQILSIRHAYQKKFQRKMTVGFCYTAFYKYQLFYDVIYLSTRSMANFSLEKNLYFCRPKKKLLGLHLWHLLCQTVNNRPCLIVFLNSHLSIFPTQKPMWRFRFVAYDY